MANIGNNCAQVRLRKDLKKVNETRRLLSEERLFLSFCRFLFRHNFVNAV